MDDFPNHIPLENVEFTGRDERPEPPASMMQGLEGQPIITAEDEASEAAAKDYSHLSAEDQTLIKIGDERERRRATDSNMAERNAIADRRFRKARGLDGPGYPVRAADRAGSQSLTAEDMAEIADERFRMARL